MHTIDGQMAEGDKVIDPPDSARDLLGECLGFQPTGKAVEVSGIAVHRVSEGRLVEHWAHMDMAGFMQQIGDSAAVERVS